MISADTIRQRGMGIKIDPREEAMEDLRYIDKARLVERHAEEVKGLIERHDEDVEGWKAQSSDLGDVIRKERRENTILRFALVSMALLALYIFSRDAGCSMPWWY